MQKKDSIILYLQSIQVWQDSPLYHQYQEMIQLAIENKVSLKSLAIGGKSLTWEEMEGLVKLQDELT